MSLFVCKCLNINLETEEKEDNVEIEKLELSSVEQRDTFFSEKLVFKSGPVKMQVAQQALTAEKVVGRWMLYFCLACGQTTHAQTPDCPQKTLIKKNSQTSIKEVVNMKQSNNYSQVFNILVPEITRDIEMKENIDTNNFADCGIKICLSKEQAIGSLNKQLSQKLAFEHDTLQEIVRQFKVLKYAEFEAYRERAKQEHEILVTIVNKSRSNVDSEGSRVDASLELKPLSPQLPHLNSRRLSLLKDANKFNQNNVKSRRDYPPDEDSLEAEDIFELEGTDSNGSHNDMNSDQEAYDSDNSISHNEGINISRGCGAHNDIARSLPINMPKFPNGHPATRDLDDEDEPEDIAASIKALARSVHGDVLGELPRPRFSTQI